MFTKSMHSKIENRPLLTMRWKTVYSMYGKDDFPSIIDSIRAVKYTEHFFVRNCTLEHFSSRIEGTFQKWNKGFFPQKFYFFLYKYRNRGKCFSEIVLNKESGRYFEMSIFKYCLKNLWIGSKKQNQ